MAGLKEKIIPSVVDSTSLYRDLRTGTQYIGNWASRELTHDATQVAPFRAGPRQGLYWGYTRVTLGLYWDNGKETGKYYLGFRVSETSDPKP